MPDKGKKILDIDWILFGSVIPLLLAGLSTMNSFVKDDYFAGRQVVWIIISLAVFFLFSLIDWRFMKNGWILFGLFVISSLVLLLLFWGGTIRGVKSWISIFSVSIQPADFTKLILIFILAKYFSRRHVEIAHIRHILVSGFYAAVPFVLVLFQPDFGSAVVIFCIWLGMIIISGVSKKHLIMVFALGAIAFSILWFAVFLPHQKQRIISFIDPTADIRGAGYNVFQSQIAVGSGMVLGKGVGFGTQSRLRFLPEYETDFIFAAFAEEWGFVGVALFFAFFATVIWRILLIGYRGVSNFETLFSIGVAVFLMSHFIINVGMNIGLLPVTGITLPFVSYGGSHLLTEFAALGILMSMRKYARATHRDNMKNEFLGME